MNQNYQKARPYIESEKLLIMHQLIRMKHEIKIEIETEKIVNYAHLCIRNHAGNQVRKWLISEQAKVSRRPFVSVPATHTLHMYVCVSTVIKTVIRLSSLSNYDINMHECRAVIHRQTGIQTVITMH